MSDDPSSPHRGSPDTGLPPADRLPLTHAPLYLQRAGAALKRVLEARNPDYVYTIYYRPQDND